MNIGALEQQVLLAVVGQHPDAYGVSIQERIKQRTGKEPSIGSVYAALDRLVEKGFVKVREGAPTTERGGRRKYHYAVTATGQSALKESLEALSSLQRGLRWREAFRLAEGIT